MKKALLHFNLWALLFLAVSNVSTSATSEMRLIPEVQNSVSVPVYIGGNGNEIEKRNKTMNFSWPSYPKAGTYKIGFATDKKMAYTFYSKTNRKRVALAPGEYIWYVWPIVNGLEQKAIIASRFKTNS